MRRELLHAKIYGTIVTEAVVDYMGSITIDEDLMDKVGIWHGEKVLVVSNTSAARLWTYVMRGKRGSGCICMNGAAAKLIKKGEKTIVMAFASSEKPVRPKVAVVDRHNRFARYLKEDE